LLTWSCSAAFLFMTTHSQKDWGLENWRAT
jgi:hypothetical protein